MTDPSAANSMFSKLLSGLNPGGAGLSGLKPAGGAGSPEAALFELQMQLARSGMGTDAGDSSDGLESNIMKNALTLDALVTLNKMKNLTSGPNGGLSPASFSSAGAGFGPQAYKAAETAAAEPLSMKQVEGSGSMDSARNDVSGPKPFPDAAGRNSGTSAPATEPGQGSQSVMEQVEGLLSSMFESGKDGISTIGYDRTGGTSYGKFQLASRVGTMDRFIDFLKEHAPQWADRLAQAGPANTRSKSGAMPEEWKRIAQEDPKKFEELQTKFIRDSYFDPALNGVLESTGINLAGLGPVVQEVLWSTSVQHGVSGAVSIFSKAMNGISAEQKQNGFEFAKQLIQSVYDNRAGQFGSSTERVQASVQNRFLNEKNLAMSLLLNESGLLG